MVEGISVAWVAILVCSLGSLVPRSRPAFQCYSLGGSEKTTKFLAENLLLID